MPTARSIPPSTAAWCASARTRRGSPGGPRACASRRSMQADGRIVVGGARGGAMIARALQRRRHARHDLRHGRLRDREASPARRRPRPARPAATALALDAAGNVLATGFGGSQSMFVARFSPTGAMTGSVVCFAPHLIDYTAHALAARPDGSVVIVGQARDRWHGTPYRSTACAPSCQVTGGSARTTAAARGAPRRSTRATIGSSGVTIDGLTLDGVAAQREPGGSPVPRRGGAGPTAPT